MFSRPRVHFLRRLEYKWLVVVSITLGMFMSIMDSTIVNVAIPTMRSQFHASLSVVQWVVTVYMLAQAAVIPAAPYLAHRFGSKRAYVGTLGAFLIGSILCGFAWDLRSLIFFRFIQGVGGGVLLPMVMTLLFRAFPHEERGRATSTMSIPLMAAPLLGPVLGGYLVSRFGWPWAFFINGPLGVFALWIAVSVLEGEDPDRHARLDVFGLSLAAFGSSATLFGVSGVVTEGFVSIRGLALGLGLVCLGAFVAYELRIARGGGPPLLDLTRFADRTFALSVFGICFQTAAFFGALFLIPIYLQALRHQTSFRSGEIQAAQAVATLITTPFAGRLADRIGPKPVALTGFVVLAFALAMLHRLDASISFFGVAALLIPVGIGGGLAGQGTVCAMSNIGKDERKEITNASTILSVLRATAAPMGVALASGLVQYGSRWTPFDSGRARFGGAIDGAFLVSAGLAAVAAGLLAFVPRRGRRLGVDEVVLSLE